MACKLSVLCVQRQKRPSTQTYENKTCDRGDAVYVLRHGEIKTSLDTAAQHGAGAIIHVDDIWAKQELIASGGIGRLPVFMEDGDARLKRASDVLPDLGWKLWMVTHEAFKTSPRLKVIMSEISAYFDALDDTRDGAAH